jgi:hypothetical protein
MNQTSKCTNILGGLQMVQQLRLKTMSLIYGSAYSFPACEVAALICVGAQFGTNVVDHYSHIKMTKQIVQQQQQQQHSLLSQASWGRLEMKPKRDEKQGDT